MGRDGAVTGDPSAIAAEAKALKARFPHLLAREPSFDRPDLDRREDAIDAARRRLRGGELPVADQLSLDELAR
jgi:hypothetical protein